MGFTLDFILLFILVVIPGLLFKRFYFSGEFSKQFNTKDPIYKSIFYSIAPGIIIQIICFSIFTKITDISSDNISIFNAIKEITSGKKEISLTTKGFLNNDMSLFFSYIFCSFMFSILVGIISFRIVRIMKLDVKHKIFRFKNQWYYIFSGEIKSFKKFINANNIINEIHIDKNKFKYYPPYADILIKSNSDTPTLYSGYVIDYDLDYNNINDIHKLYLFKAHRYRPIRNEEDTKDKIVKGSRIKVPIDGDVFVLSASDIINMNLTFIPSDINQNSRQERKIKLRGLIIIAALFNISIFFYFIFINVNFINGLIPQIDSFVDNRSFFFRMLLALIITQFIALLLPQEVKTEGNIDYQYSKKDFGFKFILLVIFSSLYFIFR